MSGIITPNQTLVGSINSNQELKANISVGILELSPELEDLTVTPSIEQQTFNHPNSYGYDEVIVNAVNINLQDKTVNPTTSEQTIEADNGYDALSSVVVNPVTNAIDENIQANNIKNGVEILGTTGTVVELVGEAREITQNGNYTPSSGKNAITSLSVNVAPDTSDATAVAGDISSGKTAYTASGKVIGTLPDCWDMTKKNSGNALSYIKTVPLFDTSSYTSFLGMFRDFLSLEEIPLFDTSNVTTFGGMFTGCVSLTTIPLLDTSNVTIMSGMFERCTSLEEIPLFDTSKVTSMSNMFTMCYKITTIPLFDTSEVTSMSYMFYSCSILMTVPLLDTSNVTNISNVFYQTYRIQNLGGFLNLGQAYLTTASANYSNYALNLSSQNSLTHDSLMNVINNLYDIATKGCNTQKLQLGTTNLAKLTAQEIAIATAKGFTVS